MIYYKSFWSSFQTIGIYLFWLNCKIQCKKKTFIGKINEIWIEEEWWIVEEISLGKIIYDLALTLDYHNFKKVAKKKDKTGLDTRNHIHGWDYTNIFWCSILGRCYHMAASKESMNSTLTDVLDKILTGRKKINFFRSVPFLYSWLTTIKPTSKYSPCIHITTTQISH